MPDIFILDGEQTHRKRLKELCLQYLFQKNREADIQTAEIEGKLSEYLADTNLLSLFLLSYQDLTGKGIKEIRSSNLLNYIVLIFRDMQEVMRGINPASRPAGCLLKPVEEAEIEQMLDDIWSDYEEIKGEEAQFLFKINGAEYSVSLGNILFFEANSKKIILRTESQEFEFYDSMEKISKRLPEYFVRIHKSFLVNIKKISKVDYPGMSVFFDDGSFAFVSRTYKARLQEALAGEAGND